MTKPAPRMRRPLLLAALLAAASVLPAVDADGIISSTNVALGVHDEGNLILTGAPVDFGLRELATNLEGLGHGCNCEGWGVSYDGWVDGYAHAFYGTTAVALTTVSPGPGAYSASLVGGLLVEHHFTPNPGGISYTIDTVITNIDEQAHADVRYRRAMDWDADPTPYFDRVTIALLAPPPTTLVYSSNDGFAFPSPLSGATSLGSVGPPTGGPFFDVGAFDHGAMFDLCFGVLLPGEHHHFGQIYGAAPSESAAITSLAANGAEVYSLGQNAIDYTGGMPVTFFYGLHDRMDFTAEPCEKTQPPRTAFAAEQPRASNTEL